MTVPAPAQLTLLLAFMGLLNSFCSDMVIPAVPALSADLGISGWQAQQTISLFFVASAFVSLWYGAMADAYGRRATILAALLLLGLSAAASTAVASIGQLWALRIVQGMAAGAGLVISRAILSDLHHGVTAQHLLSRITLLQTLSLVATPVLGAWLSAHYGWRMVFATLSGIAFALAAVYWRWLPETLPAGHRLELRPARLARAYLAVLGNPRFARLTLAHVANWTSMAIYAVSAPVIVTRLLGRPATDIYLVYGPITLGLTAGFAAFPRVHARLHSHATLGAAYACLAGSVALGLLSSWQWPTGVVPLLALLVYSLGLALALPLLLSHAVETERQRAGVAASCQTFFQFAGMALSAGLIAPLLWDALWSLAFGTGLLTLAGGIALALERRAEQRRPAGATCPSQSTETS